MGGHKAPLRVSTYVEAAATERAGCQVTATPPGGPFCPSVHSPPRRDQDWPVGLTARHQLGGSAIWLQNPNVDLIWTRPDFLIPKTTPLMTPGSDHKD